MEFYFCGLLALTAYCPPSLETTRFRNLSLIGTKQHNLRKFSPSKINHYMVYFSIPFLGTAVVLMLATSDPLPTSLTPRQATTSPAMVGTRNCFFNSSLPNRERAGTAMSVRRGKVENPMNTNYLKESCYQNL